MQLTANCTAHCRHAVTRQDALPRQAGAHRHAHDGPAASPAEPQDHNTQNKQTRVVAIHLHNLQGHMTGCSAKLGNREGLWRNLTPNLAVWPWPKLPPSPVRQDTAAVLDTTIAPNPDRP